MSSDDREIPRPSVGTGAADLDPTHAEVPPAAELSSEAAGGAGSWGEHMEGQPAGHVDPSVGANLGGSPSHQRPSFSDPIAAIADDVAGAVDPDGRVERIANRPEAGPAGAEA